MLKDKHIVLGVSGSIAAYKAVPLARSYLAARAEVWSMLTTAATRFVGPLTFSALTGKRVVLDMWSAAEAGEIGHVELAHRADALVLAPATADLIARIAKGRADDHVTAVALATRAPILIAPAMEEGMWQNPATQENVRALRARGVTIVPPGEGPLASGRSGVGRLADPEEIFEATLALLTPQDLAGRRVVVTAGPTREAFDPARFVSNASSGKMGYAIATVARRRGASVTLISGPTALPPPPGVELLRVTTTAEMLEACQSALTGAWALIMAAAPADYRPATSLAHKHKKSPNERLEVVFESTPDILRTLDPRAAGVLAVGFAAESRDLIANARSKLTAKNLDLIVANDITRADAGFACDTNAITILDRDDALTELPVLPKQSAASAIFDALTRFAS